MRVRVLYFGVLKDVVKRDREEREMAEGGTVGELLAALGREASSAVWSRVAVGVNREYVRLATVLRDGDEVALLPPVSGGRDAR